MRRLVLFLALLSSLLITTVASRAQHYIQGSIQQGDALNKVDILFLPNYNSAVGEKALYVSISIAVPTASAVGATASIVGTGPFGGMTLTPAGNYIAGSETIFSWIWGGGPATATPWTANVPFVGATITFSGGFNSNKVRLVDFMNHNPSGGGNSNTYFLVYTTSNFDVTNYNAFFYSTAGVNGATVGNYPNGDQYVETNALIDLGCSSQSVPGIISGASFLKVGDTTTYTTTGTPQGVWNSSNPSVATINSVTGFATTLSEGITNITYTITSDCGNLISASQSLVVDSLGLTPCNPTPNAGLITGKDLLCVGSTAVYSSNGNSGRVCIVRQKIDIYCIIS